MLIPTLIRADPQRNRQLGPIFSTKLDADPAVKSWLDGLSAEEKRSLRDDLTPMIKEIPTTPAAFECLPSPMVAGDSLDGETLEGMRERILGAAERTLPDWQLRAFRLWIGGMNRNRIARELGVSRATVRSALDGQDHRGDQGAISAAAAALSQDEVFIMAARKKLEEVEEPDDHKLLNWFKGIPHRPELFAPLAFLLLLDAMADSRRQVRIQDVLPLVPRSIITPFLLLLRGHGFAASNGSVITIHRVPNEKETDKP